MIRGFLMIGLGLGLSACASLDGPTRNAPFEQMPDTEVTAPEGYELTAPERTGPPPVAALTANSGDKLTFAPGKSPVQVRRVRVNVPRTLKVSEANSYLPSGDIVWRGDPIGDRHVQVQKIVQDAMTRGVKSLNGPVQVDVDVQITKFHALTEKTRYTIGGVHAISFLLAIRDAKTGELIVPVRRVRADLDGFGGQQAIDAEARGQTQKVRITDHLAEVIRQELTDPDGYKNAASGFIQKLNYM